MNWIASGNASGKISFFNIESQTPKTPNQKLYLGEAPRLNQDPFHILSIDENETLEAHWSNIFTNNLWNAAYKHNEEKRRDKHNQLAHYQGFVTDRLLFSTTTLFTSSPNGEYFLHAAQNQLFIWRNPQIDPKTTGFSISNRRLTNIFDATFNDESNLALLISKNGKLTLLDLKSKSIRFLDEISNEITTAVFIPKTKHCLLATSDGKLLKINTKTISDPEKLSSSIGKLSHMISIPQSEYLLTAGPGEQLGVRRISDGVLIVNLTHHGLAMEPGRHNLKRLFYFPKKQRLLSLSEDGWLAQW